MNTSIFSKFIMIAVPFAIAFFILIPNTYAAEDHNSSRSNLSNVIDKDAGNSSDAQKEVKAVKEILKDGSAGLKKSSSPASKGKKK